MSKPINKQFKRRKESSAQTAGGKPKSKKGTKKGNKNIPFKYFNAAFMLNYAVEKGVSA